MALFKDILLEWLRLKSRSLKPSTAYAYQMMIERRIIPALGHLPVTEITIEILEDYIDHLHLVSTKNYQQVIKPALDMATRRGLIRYNPCDDLVVRKLIAAAPVQWQKDVIELSFRTGMRAGEIFALQWSDVDLSRSSITVRGSCVYAPEHGVQRDIPKTACSIRSIDIDSHCVAILRRTPHTSDYVFGRSNGDPRDSRTIHMGKICDKAGIPRRSLRHMRSTHISLLVARGVSLPEIQRRVGHASPETLLRYYAQFEVGAQDACVEAFDEIDLGP